MVVGFVLIFLVGFGAGRFEKSLRRDNVKSQSNYTTQQDKKPLVTEAPAGQTTAQNGEGTVAGNSTTTVPTDCKIKGNIASGGKKLFHVKGGAFYDRTNAEMCFNTEAEALAAGFVKSSR